MPEQQNMEHPGTAEHPRTVTEQWNTLEHQWNIAEYQQNNNVTLAEHLTLIVYCCYNSFIYLFISLYLRLVYTNLNFFFTK